MLPTVSLWALLIFTMHNTTFPKLICSSDTIVFLGGMDLIFANHVDVLALFLLITEGSWGFDLTL
jgi:hypothetical protein